MKLSIMYALAGGAPTIRQRMAKDTLIAHRDVDLVDFASLQNCFTGLGESLSAGCGSFDFDEDGDVDLLDFEAFSHAVDGPR